MTAETRQAECSWTPAEGYRPRTAYGEIRMFEAGGQRAVELMLLANAACLTYYLVKNTEKNALPVSGISVRSEGEIAPDGNSVARITTRVRVDGAISQAQREEMLRVCEALWKVGNTLQRAPEMEVLIER